MSEVDRHRGRGGDVSVAAAVCPIRPMIRSHSPIAGALRARTSSGRSSTLSILTNRASSAFSQRLSRPPTGTAGIRADSQRFQLPAGQRVYLGVASDLPRRPAMVQTCQTDHRRRYPTAARSPESTIQTSTPSRSRSDPKPSTSAASACTSPPVSQPPLTGVVARTLCPRWLAAGSKGCHRSQLFPIHKSPGSAVACHGRRRRLDPTASRKDLYTDQGVEASFVPSSHRRGVRHPV